MSVVQRWRFNNCHKGQLISLDVLSEVLKELPAPGHLIKSSSQLQPKGDAWADGVKGYVVLDQQGAKIELETFPSEGSLIMTTYGPRFRDEELVPTENYLERQFGFKGLPVDLGWTLC